MFFISNRGHHLLIALFLTGLMAFLGFYVHQDAFRPLLLGYGAFYLGLLWVVFGVPMGPREVRWYYGLGFGLRFMLLFAFPLLSDDIFRFLWDGHLVAHGENPFAYLPSDLLGLTGRPPGLSLELYDQLNSRRVYTVYPPLAQLSFAIASWLAGNSWYWGAFVLKSILLACEGLTLWLLPKMLLRAGVGERQGLIYALNPLVILEGVGNLHYEVMVFALMLLAVWWLFEKRLGASAIALTLAIAAKLFPLMFLPFWLRQLERKDLFRYFTIVGVGTIAIFSPLWSGLWIANMGESLNLYFRKFEFNASVFNLVKWLGYQWKGYNLIKRIGPFLALHSFAGIWIGAWVQRDLSMAGLFRIMMMALSLYLFLATTVHPWYLIPLIGFSCFTGFRFAFLWSGLAVFSYSQYMEIPFAPHYGWIALEYIPVFALLLWELIKFSRGALR